tara:strand:+ start:791 stop:1435 length:645 start_codon:yes stop_codon:yes gene_type:complete
MDTPKFTEDNLVNMEGHIKIWDPESGQVYVNKRNAINFENMSIALASAMANAGYGTVYEMHFGNGGTVVNANGTITYRTPNTNGQNEDLYSTTFFKVVDANDTVNNTDITQNFTSVTHVNNTNYTDIVITCTIDYDEPVATDTTFNLAGQDQDAQDSATDFTGSFVFDELGLKSKSSSANLNSGLLLTHVVFHPVQKSANRLLQVVYTLRIRAG